MLTVRTDGTLTRVDEVRRLRPAAGEVLVRVGAVAIDRRDGEIAGGGDTLRLDAEGRRTLGRHVAGVVAAPGVGVDSWPLGRQVAVQPETALRGGWHVPGAQHDGGLAEYVVAPAAALVLLPRDLPLTVGALLPLAARAHGMLRHVRVQLGESVGIWGAGSLGGAAIAVARAMGAVPIIVIDPDVAARRSALDLGADTALDPRDPGVAERIHALTAGRGLDAALHASCDASAARVVVDTLGPTGRAVLAGPVGRVGERERWDGRTLSGPPRTDPESLPLVAHLAASGRLRLAAPELTNGLAGAADLLDTAVRDRSAVVPSVVTC